MSLVYIIGIQLVRSVLFPTLLGTFLLLVFLILLHLRIILLILLVFLRVVEPLQHRVIAIHLGLFLQLAQGIGCSVVVLLHVPELITLFLSHWSIIRIADELAEQWNISHLDFLRVVECLGKHTEHLTAHGVSTTEIRRQNMVNHSRVIQIVPWVTESINAVLLHIRIVVSD